MTGKKQKLYYKELFSFLKTKTVTYTSSPKVLSSQNGLSYVSRNGKSQKSSMQLELNDVKIEEATGTKSDPIELLAPEVNYCGLCGNIGKYCHNICYGEFCICAVYTFLHNNTKSQCFGENWTGCSKETITGVFKRAYNDDRRSDLKKQFGFFNSTYMSLPECMKEGSLKKATGIMYDSALVKELKEKNEEGYQRFCVAKSHYSK